MKRLGGILTACVLTTGLALTATPASAVDLSIKICNSSNSRGPLKIFSNNWPNGTRLDKGNCNTYGAVASIYIDPDYEGYGYGDVDSTHWGFEGHGLDYCQNGEGTLNPPDSTGGLYVKYNTDASYC